jgi:hypothetical protein
MPAKAGSSTNDEERIYGRGDDFGCVRVDPKKKT